MRTKRIIRIIIFILIFFILLGLVTFVMVDPDHDGAVIVKSFYETADNSLDAVYIGSSNSFTYWNSMLGWEQYGICIHPLAANANPFWTTKEFIRLARKKQPNALYIVNINTYSEINNEEALHNVIDVFPFSFGKLRMIHNLCDYANVSLEERIGYYIPIIRYHSWWSDVRASDFTEMAGNPYMGSYDAEKYLNRDENITKNYCISKKIGTLTQKESDTINELLDYCDQEKIKVLFIIVPQNKPSHLQEQYNAVQACIEKRGYPVLNLYDKTDEIGLDLKTDFYNESHTNIHGSAKYTFYLSEYLIEKYGFSDKRDKEEYQLWNEKLVNYRKVLTPYLLDIEHIPFANTAKMSVLNVNVICGDNSTSVTWDRSDGADGYLIYRKEDMNSDWMVIADTKELFYLDEQSKGKTEIYTVVPYCGETKREYGSFLHAGVQAQ